MLAVERFKGDRAVKAAYAELLACAGDVGGVAAEPVNQAAVVGPKRCRQLAGATADVDDQPALHARGFQGLLRLRFRVRRARRTRQASSNDAHRQRHTPPIARSYAPHATWRYSFPAGTFATTPVNVAFPAQPVLTAHSPTLGRWFCANHLRRSFSRSVGDGVGFQSLRSVVCSTLQPGHSRKAWYDQSQPYSSNRSMRSRR